MIDLHQDLVLSYQKNQKQFFDFDPTTYDDSLKINVWSLQDYKKAWMFWVFWAVWPYDLEWDLEDKETRKITFNEDLMREYITTYKRLAESNDVNILTYWEFDTHISHLSILIHIEGLDLDISEEYIDKLYNEQVRSIWFVRNFDNYLSHCNLHPYRWITKKWHQIIQYMNKKWMIVDTAHMSDRAMMDVCRIAEKPIINSHSNLKAHKQHTRNVSDNFLKELAKNWWVQWLSLCASFQDASDEKFENYTKQIDYVYNLVWDDHVAFWSDLHWLTRNDIIWGITNIQNVEQLHERIVAKFWSSFSQKFFFDNANRVVKQNIW